MMIFRPVGAAAALSTAALMLAACGPTAKVITKVATKAAGSNGVRGAARAGAAVSHADEAAAAVSHADEAAAGAGEASHGRRAAQEVAQEVAQEAGQYYVEQRVSDNTH